MVEKYGEINLKMTDLKDLHFFGGKEYNAEELTLTLKGMEESLQEPPMTVRAGPPRRISCDCLTSCSDYPEKCKDCERNVSKSYFKPKEVKKVEG